MRYQTASEFWRKLLDVEQLSPRRKEFPLVVEHASVWAINSKSIRRYIERALTATGASEEEDTLDVLIAEETGKHVAVGARFSHRNATLRQCFR